MSTLHTWMSTDTPEYDTCLVCGGMWQEKYPGEVVSEHQSWRGEYPSPCTANTSACHHYSGECPVTDGSECQVDLECNCLFCDS